MTVAALRSREEKQLLIAVVCTVPMVFEGLRDELASIAEVRAFPARHGTSDLLRLVEPDIVVVDCDEEAEDAVPFANEYGLPLVHVAVRDGQLRVYKDGVWRSAGGAEGATPEMVRNVVAGGLFARSS